MSRYMYLGSDFFKNCFSDIRFKSIDTATEPETTTNNMKIFLQNKQEEMIS